LAFAALVSPTEAATSDASLFLFLLSVEAMTLLFPLSRVVVAVSPPPLLLLKEEVEERNRFFVGGLVSSSFMVEWTLGNYLSRVLMISFSSSYLHARIIYISK
jgi:hypothetical protein